MDEHPVALATMARSPNNCETSFRYGVSPHPEQAPENSNSGSCTCCWRIVPTLILRRSSSGILRKNSQFSLSGARSGGCGTMLMAFSRTSLLFFTGQTSTQTPHPVQSSGATWMVYFMPAHSLSRAAQDLKVPGAPSSSLLSYTLIRMTACGQTIAHLPHWMQIFESHAGISSARLRFSQREVAVGKVPSQENALTGSSSPRPA